MLMTYISEYFILTTPLQFNTVAQNVLYKNVILLMNYVIVPDAELSHLVLVENICDWLISNKQLAELSIYSKECSLQQFISLQQFMSKQQTTSLR